jgi:rhodanese-related sulfurtransferase
MKTLTAEQLKQMRQKNGHFLLINTLDEEHFAKTKIPGAINLPQSRDDFVHRVEQAADSKNDTIVVYCASEKCNSSPKAAEKLEKAGFSNVLDFEAGAEGWQQAGEQLASD